jgi:chemotaxis protein methyltransferase CheR
MTDLGQFKDLIRTRTGLMLDGGDEPLAQALDKRIAATGAGGRGAYFARLLANAEEFHELVTLLTINETYFYRQPEQLELLVGTLMPQLMAEEGGRLPIRILSAGCSTGEEPYSIAIALLEAFGEGAARLVEIIAGDIDHHALAKARHGRYGAFSFRAMPEHLRAKYFRRADGEALEVDERVKAMVTFHPLNLLAERFPAHLQDLDVVFLRNVSIYFDEPTRRTIQLAFHRAMTARGRLVIGSAETLANDLGVFRLVEDAGRFHFVKSAELRPRTRPVLAWSAPAEPRPAPPPVAPVMVPLPPPLPPRPDQVNVDEVRALMRTKRFAMAEARLAPRNRLPPADPKLLALEGYARMMGRDFDGAATIAAEAWAADEWSVDAMVVLGLVAKWQQRSDEAVRWFKQAVYARHDCWPAHYYLAELLRAQGAKLPARRSYRIALQQVNERPDPDGGLLLPLDLPVAEVRFLCERHAGGSAAARR